MYPFVHVLSGCNILAFDIGVSVCNAGASDQYHLGTRPPRGFGDGQALQAGAVIADVAHGVDGFTCGSCRYRYRAACQGTLPVSRDRLLGQSCEQVLGFGHTSGALISAGLSSAVGANDAASIGFEGCQITLNGRVLVHLLVHGRRDAHWGRTGQAQCAQKIRGLTRGHSGDHAGSRRRNQDLVRPPC